MTRPKRRPSKPTKPPAHLSERAKGLWQAVVPSRAKSPERLAMVQSALESLDRADQAAALVRDEGMTVTAKKGGLPHVHPAVRVERDARAMFVRTWGGLALSWNHEIDGR